MGHGTKVPWPRYQARILDEEDETSPMSGLMSLICFFFFPNKPMTLFFQTNRETC